MITRRRATTAVCVGLVGAALFSGACAFVRMPGAGHVGPLPAASDDEKALALSLRSDVEFLAGTIGERNDSRPAALDASVDFLTQRFEKLGYSVALEEFSVATVTGVVFRNLVIEKKGTKRPDEIVLIGAVS